MQHFNPDWSDFIRVDEVLDIPLHLPKTLARKQESSIGVDCKKTITDTWAQEEIRLPVSRLMTCILRKSEAGKNHILTRTNSHGEVEEMTSDDPMYDFIFPPRVWMSDCLQERSSMYQAALIGEGHVLIGGLGLGIYPQFLLHLQRPIKSVTIVDFNADIIGLISPLLVQAFKDKGIRLNIIYDSIEQFMAQTNERFDTIYLDIWGDLHFKFLGYINYLIAMAEKIVSPTGKIQAWGYHYLYQEFIATAQVIEPHADKWDDFEVETNVILRKYLEWRKAQVGDISMESIVAQAAYIARHTQDDTPISLSIDMARSRFLQPQLL